MDLRYAQENADAIMQAWYPGARGGRVIAKMLFGEISPSGKLPITFYNDTDDLPEFTDYSMKGRTYRYLETAPLYPFGYGLTYGDVQALDATYEDGTLTVTVSNNSNVATQEVVQVYIKDRKSAFATTAAKLCGFERVTVGAGEQKNVKVTLDRDAFTVINDEGEKVVDGDTFVISAGLGQGDARTKELTGKENITLTVLL